ncbi:MAG: hypothetical protein Q4P13_10380 [Psychrobacter sp.]|nr:hypothetical protein [Psychrobacter sp.]
MSQRTKVIEYNLADRGRKHNGVDRNDLDIRSMVNVINSDAVQELVSSGDLFGYNGHEIRARFGMNPPDKYVNEVTGAVIRIEPAIRTVKLKADSSGNVTTQHEFLDTDDGRYALKLYKQNVGGFSSAITRKQGNGGLYQVTGFYGYDHVRIPNYNTNKGNGMFDALVTGQFDEEEYAFDSISGLPPEKAVLKDALELVIAKQYDSMRLALEAEGLVNHYQEQAILAQDELMKACEAQDRRYQRRAQRKQEIYDSMICPAEPFEKIEAEWDGFFSMGTSHLDLMASDGVATEKTQAAKKPKIFGRR